MKYERRDVARLVLTSSPGSPREACPTCDGSQLVDTGTESRGCRDCAGLGVVLAEHARDIAERAAAAAPASDSLADILAERKAVVHRCHPWMPECAELEEARGQWLRWLLGCSIPSDMSAPVPYAASRYAHEEVVDLYYATRHGGVR